MPKKVPFQVIHNTGWEEDYSPKDLEVHSPFGKGWRSPRFCLYPQELVMKLDPPARIRKLQLLSHQYLIPTVVELYVGHFTSRKGGSMERTKFERLGYISFSNNEASRFKSMELKSVNIDCIGELVKLVLYQNHINHFNLYNQIGLVAFNVIAEPLSPDQYAVPKGVPLVGVMDLVHKSSTNGRLASLLNTYLPGINQSQTGSTNAVLKGRINKPARISPMDDLKFAISQDPETANIIRKLEKKKQASVDAENFREAKKLKLVIEELSKAGEVLCRYEVEKKQAIEREDYDTAKIKKERLDEARQLIYTELGVHGLLSDGKHTAFSRTHAHTHGASPAHHYLPKVIGQSHADHIAASTTTPNTDRLRGEDRLLSPVLPPISHHTSTTSPAHPSTRIPADERPLPALQRSGGPSTVLEQEEVSPKEREGPGRSEEEGTDGEEGEESFATEPLTEKQQNQVSLAVDIFGMEMMEQLYAKRFSTREHALSSVQEVLATQPKTTPRETSNLVKATCQVLLKGFDDQVFSTFQKTQELLHFMLGEFAHKHSLSNQDITQAMEKVVPALLTRAGDTSPRIGSTSADTITVLMKHPRIREMAIIGPMLLEPFKSNNPSWRLIRARIVLLGRLLEDPTIAASSGLDVKKIMTYNALYLEHSSKEVRQAAIELTLQLYKLNGREVRSLMPAPDNAASRKKFLWKTIYEGFDKIDGVPTPAEREAMSRAAQKAKDEEIQQLQIEIAAMKRIVTTTKLEKADIGGGAVVTEARQTNQANGESAVVNEARLSNQISGESAETRQTNVERAVSTEARQTNQTNRESAISRANGESAVVTEARQLNQVMDTETGKLGQAELQESETAQMNQTDSVQPANSIHAGASIDRMCVFCGEQQESESAIEQHYLACPMLQSCSYCDQVVEISGLTKHWLTECQAKGKFQKCPLCGEAVLKSQFDDHVTSGNCRAKQRGEGGEGDGVEMARCPLCHQDIILGDEGWRKHLMGAPHLSTTCPNRRLPRRTNGAASKQGDAG